MATSGQPHSIKMRATDGAGRLLRLVDRACSVLYVAVSAVACGALVWLAWERSLWLLLPAVPAVLTTGLLAYGLVVDPDRGLRLEWPVRRRRLRIQAPTEDAPRRRNNGDAAPQ